MDLAARVAEGISECAIVGRPTPSKVYMGAEELADLEDMRRGAPMIQMTEAEIKEAGGETRFKGLRVISVNEPSHLFVA